MSVVLDGRSSHLKSGRENQFNDGTVVREFSAAAQAVSQFSLKVEGKLNEEELAAIQVLVGKVSPIAQNFFSALHDFDVEEASSSLAVSLGVIEEIELKLERTPGVSSEVVTQEVVQQQENLPENADVVILQRV